MSKYKRVDQEDIVYTNSGILLSYQEKYAICSNTDGAGRKYAK